MNKPSTEQLPIDTGVEIDCSATVIGAVFTVCLELVQPIQKIC